jgi:hypothetical protein
VKKRIGTKPVYQEPVVVEPKILESAKKAVFEPIPPKTFPCRVCSSEGATEQSDGLCWVCRRLKISAWRDVEQQLPLSE